MRGGLRLGRLFGIPVYLHFTWFVVFSLVTFSLALGYFPHFYQWSPWLNWTVGVATSLLFFASVVAHELTHSLVSQAYGVPVKSITLFIFGGMARLGREASRPRREFLMALAGPLSSLALAGFFGLVSWAVSHRQEPVAALAWWLMRINVLLALFNLIPGFPLDGGRVLRALLWGATGNYLRATRLAVLVGRVVGYLFIAGGIGLALLTVEWLGGLWLAFIGWFLENAASNSYQQTRLREALRGVTAAEVMSQEFSVVPSSVSLEEVVQGVILPRGSRAVVVAERGRLMGMLTPGNIRAVPPSRWPVTLVEKVMVPTSRLILAQPEEEALGVLERMEEEDTRQMAVVRAGEVLGILFVEQILHLARTRMELGAG